MTLRGTSTRAAAVPRPSTGPGAAAEGLARDLLAGQPDRFARTVAVARRAAELAVTVEPADRELLLAAAWLHDVGHAAELRDTGFAPLDAAEHLTALRRPPVLAGLVAHHSGARFLAEVRGVGPRLARFPCPEGPVLDALTYADQTVGPDGLPVRMEDRMADTLRRHGPGSPAVRVHDVRGPYLRGVAARVETRRIHSSWAAQYRDGPAGDA